MIKETLKSGVNIMNDEVVMSNYHQIDFIKREIRGGNRYYISINGTKYLINKWQAHKYIMTLGFKEKATNSKYNTGVLLYEKGRGDILRQETFIKGC